MQVRTSTEQRADVESTLDDLDAEYLVVDEVSEPGSVVLYVPLPPGAVDPVHDRLRQVGLGDDAYVVVTDADAVSGVDIEGMNERLVEGPKGKRGVSNAELRERADDLWPDGATYVALAILSAFLATAGLMLDSAIVIVGAMVIAPFAGTTLSASVGWVIDDHGMVARSARAQVAGLVAALAGAIAMSLAINRIGIMPDSLQITQAEQIGFFLTPSVLALTIAVSAGAAGALALATDLPVSVAGVAVAAAIVPAVATTAIGLVWGELLVALGALMLLLMNIVSINVTAYVTLVALGYRSTFVRDSWRAAGTDLRTAGYALAVVLFLAVAGVTVYSTSEHIAFEYQTTNAVSEVVDERGYDDLELYDISTSYDDQGVLWEPESVTVTFARTSDRSHDQIAAGLREQISERTGNDVTVRVRFIDYATAEAAAESESESRGSSLASVRPTGPVSAGPVPGAGSGI